MNDYHDPQDGRRYRARLRRQKDYQARYRDKLKADRTPERDDIAAACLRLILHRAASDPRGSMELLVTIANDLAERSFSKRRTADRITAMVHRLREKHRA